MRIWKGWLVFLGERREGGRKERKRERKRERKMEEEEERGKRKKEERRGDFSWLEKKKTRQKTKITRTKVFRRNGQKEKTQTTTTPTTTKLLTNHNRKKKNENKQGANFHRGNNKTSQQLPKTTILLKQH